MPKCPICGKEISAANLHRHIGTQHGNTVYFCLGCNKSYKSSSGRDDHKKTCPQYTAQFGTVNPRDRVRSEIDQRLRNVGGVQIKNDGASTSFCLPSRANQSFISGPTISQTQTTTSHISSNTKTTSLKTSSKQIDISSTKTSSRQFDISSEKTTHCTTRADVEKELNKRRAKDAKDRCKPAIDHFKDPKKNDPDDDMKHANPVKVLGEPRKGKNNLIKFLPEIH